MSQNHLDFPFVGSQAKKLDLEFFFPDGLN